MRKKDVVIIMGSDSDLPAMAGAADILKDFKVSFDIQVVSAHRTPDVMNRFAKSAHNKYKIIIAGAGGAAHLPGMVASQTTLPVIGVPVQVGKLKALDAILSIVQMPRGVPVATVGADNSINAALLAIRILALGRASLTKALMAFEKTQKTKVKKANQRLRSKSN